MSVAQQFEFLIQWHLTERCNLRCSHCYQDGARAAELSTAEVADGLDEIGELFASWRSAHGVALTPGFNVTGGEPLLRADLLDILGMLADRAWDVDLLTNGTLVTPGHARRLAASGVKGVQVSIEGPEAVHDGLRGTGSYRASVAGIRALLDAGLTVTVNTTLSEVNVESFFELADIAAALGVQRLGFSRLVPSGRGGGLAGRMLKPGAVRDLYRRIFALSFDNMQLVTGDPAAAGLRAAQDAGGDQGDVAVGGCSAGVAGLTILADGTVVPCRRLPVSLGNIRTDSLRELWAASPALDALRDRSRYEGKCRTCGRWAVCRGCRAIVWAASGLRGRPSLLAEDPQCPLTNAECGVREGSASPPLTKDQRGKPQTIKTKTRSVTRKARQDRQEKH